MELPIHRPNVALVTRTDVQLALSDVLLELSQRLCDGACGAPDWLREQSVVLIERAPPELHNLIHDSLEPLARGLAELRSPTVGQYGLRVTPSQFADRPFGVSGRSDQ